MFYQSKHFYLLYEGCTIHCFMCSITSQDAQRQVRQIKSNVCLFDTKRRHFPWLIYKNSLLILHYLVRFKASWTHRLWSAPSVLWWRGALHQFIRLTKQVPLLCCHNLKRALPVLVFLIKCSPSAEHRVKDRCSCGVCQSAVSKPARDAAAGTDYVTWMLKASIHLGEAACEGMYSHYQPHIILMLLL